MDKTKLNFSKIIGLFVSVVFVWVFLFSVWYSNNIINQEKFVATTTQVLESETVRDAISSQIITTVQLRRPIIGSVAAPLLTKIISGVMDSNLYSNLNTKLAQELHLQLTSANPRELTIELKPTKDLLGPFIERSNPGLISSIPDSLTIIRRGQIPSLYKFGTLLTLLGPILLIAALAIMGLIWIKVTDKRNYITILSLCFTATALFVYFLIPTAGNYIAAQANTVNIATIINEVYNAFTISIYNFAFNVMLVSLAIALIARFLRRDMFRLPQRNSSKVK